MRRRLAAALGLALAATGAPSAHAVETEFLLVGSTTAYVDVTIGGWSGSYYWYPVDFTGRYVGYYVAPLGETARDESPGTGEMLFRDLGSPSGGHAAIRLGLPDDTYSHGRFRVWLIADGPARVRLTRGPTSDRPRELRPTRRVPTTAHVGPLPSGPTMARRAPVTYSRPFLAATALMVTGPAPSANEVEVCVAAPRGECREGTLGDGLGESVDDTDNPAYGTRVWSVAQRVGKGRYETVHGVHPRIRVDRAVAASFTMRLS